MLIIPCLHSWQKLRATEIECDLEMNERLMLQLTTQEREIRTQLEDVMSAPVRKLVMPGSPHLLNGSRAANGVKAKANGTSGKKGKQKH